ncbi:MAG: hypothetical protein M9936_17390 [Caldilinea sp.]|nr:hypothetical protein [Caldilinea sp.]
MVTQVTGAYADLYAWENLYAARRGRCVAAQAAAMLEYRLEDNCSWLQEESVAVVTGPAQMPSLSG